MHDTEHLRGHVGTVVVAIVLAILSLAIFVKVGGLAGDGARYSVKALVPSAQDVYPGATVRVAGLRVGTVKDVRERGGRALLTLGLEKRYAPVRRDARIEVRLRTVAGENYIELYPGTPAARALDEGDTLPMSQAVEPVQIDQVLSVLDPGTRERAQRLLKGLDSGIGGRGADVNDLVDQLARTVDRAEPVTAVLAEDRRQLARLIDNLGSLTATIGRRGGDIRALAARGRQVAEVLAERDDAARDLLQTLPPTLTQVRDTTTLLRGVTRDTAPVLTDAAAAVRGLEPAVRKLPVAARHGQDVLSELGRATSPLRDVLARARSISAPAAGALPPLRTTFCQLNPLAGYLEPYSRELGVHVANLASGVNFYNATGHAARVHAVLSESSPVIYDPNTSAALDKLLSGGVLGRVREIGWNPYPKPGGVSDLETGRNDTGPADSDLAYTRLQAAC